MTGFIQEKVLGATIAIFRGSLMLKFKWWDSPIEEINELIPLLHNNDLEYVKEKIKEIMNKKYII